MSSGTEVRESSDGAGGFVLELLVDQCSVARVNATAATLRDMSALGLELEAVRKISEAVLREQRDMVAVSSPGPTDRDCSRFASGYANSRGGTLTVGVVWYDTASDVTGPPKAPREVRQQMRVAVQRLFAPATLSQPLANALLQWQAALAEKKQPPHDLFVGDVALPFDSDDDDGLR